MKFFSSVGKILILISSAGFVLSGQSAMGEAQKKGHIFNIDGEKCTFTQTTVVAEIYLHSLKGDTDHLVFDDPNCMGAEGIELEVNQMMIANFIAYPYSHADAAFQTRPGEFKKSSMFQVRGICIQSGTYPGIGVVAEFQIAEGQILGVKHNMAVQGCSN